MVMLLTASYIFYLYTGYKYVAFLLFTTFTTYATALWIEKIAQRSKLLLKEHTFAQLRELPEEELSAIRGIGPERASALRRTFTEEKAFIDDLLAAVELRSSTGSAAAPTVCFTGKMPEKRSFYESLAREYGMEVASQVTESLTLLVAADPAEQSTKLDRARKWGTQIISPEEFLLRCPPKEPAVQEDEQLSLF
jgi:DNA ligase (NAD+)